MDEVQRRPRWMSFMSEDVEVLINADRILYVQACGDSLEIKMEGGEILKYDNVLPVTFSDRPRIDYPEETLNWEREQWLLAEKNKVGIE